MPTLTMRSALITGATGGIGRATALALARDGVSLLVNDLPGSPLGELEAELAAAGSPGVVAIPGDVSRRDEVRSMVDAAVEAFGRIDVLIANAGVIQGRHYVAELEEDDWDRVIDVNLKGTYLLCRFAVPHIPANASGRVITFSSELAYTGREELAHYCAAKAGIMGFTKSLARELGPAGITVNSVAPGPVDTAMLRANPKSYNESRRLEIPLQRWGTPEDIASTVKFLASDEASFYTGWVLSPNGGFVM